MKLILISTGILAAALSQAFGFDDITTWAGTGTKRMALVIDWNDGVQPQSLVWGFRWNGDATGLQMLNSVMATDPKLSRVMGGGGPTTLFGLGYDTDGNGLPLQGSGEDQTPVEPLDHFREGWFSSGFWGYYVASNTIQLPTTWDFGGGDFIEGNLQDQDWKGFSFAPGFNGGPPTPPSNPVPEPATCTALFTGGLFLLRRKN